jgi:hypothetical protein
MKRLSLLVILFASPCVAQPQLEVGFGSVDVTPKLTKEKPVYLAGFGHNRKATEVNDPIMARCVVLHSEKKKLALVSVDVVGLFNDVAQNVRKELPDFSYLMVSSTHNHEGPDTLGLWGANPFVSGVDPAYLKQIETGIVKSIRQADESKKPTQVEIAKIAAPELVADNREPYVKHDELVVLRFYDPEKKKKLGLMVQWNCHPETLADKNTKMSADYVHWTVESLQKSQDCPVTYFTGTVGGLMTSLKVEVKGPKGELLKDGTFEKTSTFGKLVADKTEKALQNATPLTLTPFEIRTQTLMLPMENKLYQLGWQTGVLNRKGYLWNDDPYTDKLIEAKDTEKPMGVRTEVGYLKLGELEIALIPGEIYPELVLDQIQDPADPNADFPKAEKEPAIYPQLKAKHKMLIGLANDEIGYFIPKRQWDQEAPFCYGRKQTQYGEINSIGPNAAPIICKAFQKLVQGK